MGQWQLGMFQIKYAITAHELLVWLIALYVVVLIPFYGAYPWLRSKAHVFLQGLWFSFLRLRRPPSRARDAVRARQPFRLPWRVGLTPTAKQAALALLLKFFFAPLMINWCLGHASDMSDSLVTLYGNLNDGHHRPRAVRQRRCSGRVSRSSCSSTRSCSRIGYIVEIPALKNRIRSVDPTFFGWFICLACYPPFNGFTEHFFEWQSTDFPRFENDTLHFIANISILVLMAIYSWAIVALGFKASNLTNRGIVARGPYAFVRHPAYIAKNSAWWIGALPTLYLQYAMGNTRGFFYALLALFGWTTIYLLRAITEERHLLLADNGYAQYMAKVRWRFIPGVF